MPKGKNKKVIGLIKDVLGGKIKTKFDWLRAESYSNLIDNGSKDKKAKSTKKCVLSLTTIIQTVPKQANLRIK